MSADHSSGGVHEEPGKNEHSGPESTARRSRDDSLAEVLEAEPALFGEPLLIVGTSVLTDQGDVADVVAVDGEAAVHVISVASGIADEHSVAGLSKLSAWAEPLSVEHLRGIFDAYHPDTSLEAAFEAQFAASLPGELADEPHATIVAAALDEDAAASLDQIAWATDHVHAFSYQEVVDGDDLLIVTRRLV